MRQRRHPRVQRQVGDLDLFVPQAREREQIQNLQAQVRSIVQECFPDTSTFVAHIESLGLPVLCIDHLPLMLKLSLYFRQVEDGFLVPTFPGYDALVETLIRYCPEKALFDFDHGVMVVHEENYHFAFLAYQFYHWMAFKRRLKGYDFQAARRFYKVFSEKYHRQLNPKMLEKMNLHEKKLLRYAIRREREALQFLKWIVDEVFIPSNNGALLEQGKAQA